MAATENLALARLGWDATLAAAAAELAPAGAYPGRVARVDRGWATVLTAAGTERVQLAGHSVATGDWLLHGARPPTASRSISAPAWRAWRVRCSCGS